jgi:glycosyltransferase involved in cell wall biosynthesis
VLLVHPGTQYSHHLATELQSLGYLGRFWTGFAVPSDGLVRRLSGALPPRLRRIVRNRSLPLPSARLRTRPRLEWSATLRLQRHESPQRVLHERNERFQRAVPDAEIQSSDVVIGFDTASAILAERSARLGRAFVLDQSTPHPLSKERAYETVRREFPDWATTVESREPAVLAAEEAEQRLARRIVVASSFCRSTMLACGVPAERIIVNPYGVDIEAFQPQPRGSRPLRFLFAGHISAIKGVPLLLRAWAGIAVGTAELWLVGQRPDGRAPGLDAGGVKWLGKRAAEEMPALMSQCDVLVLPSYFEGFGLVLLEAMASGLPVITSDATAGPDLVTEGREGFVIPAGDVEALQARLSFFMKQGASLPGMAAAARAVAESFTWTAYGRRWKDILDAECAPAC